MSENDEFYDECLGCGLTYDGTNLSADPDNVTIKKTATGLVSDGQLLGSLTGVFNGVSEGFNYDSACNGLKYDCETGQLWTETRPCFIESKGAGFFNEGSTFTKENVTSTQSGGTYTIVEGNHVEDLECYDGMKKFSYGRMMFKSTFTRTLDEDEVSTRLRSYSIGYDFSLSGSSGIVFSRRIEDLMGFETVDMIQTSVLTYVPFVACTEINDPVVMNYALDARADQSPDDTSLDSFNYEFKWLYNIQTFIAKEC